MKADPVYVLVPDACKSLLGNRMDRRSLESLFDVPKSPGLIVVDIVEWHGPDWARLILHYPDGRTVEGWTWHMRTLCPVRIEDPDGCLFDGRFNAVVEIPNET